MFRFGDQSGVTGWSLALFPVVFRDVESAVSGVGELKTLESQLLGSPGVEECAVRTRRSRDGQEWLVAYVVASAPIDESALRDQWQQWSGTTASTLVQVTTLPRNAEGQIDESALGKLPVIDPATHETLRSQLNDNHPSESIGSFLTDRPAPVQALHLSTIVAGWTSTAQEDLPTENDSADAASSTSAETVDVPAISHGGPLRAPADEPATLPEALERSARLHPQRGYVHVLPDGSEQEARYPEVVDEALRVCQGLREAGLRAGDRAVFQIDSGPEFLSAYWGCQFAGVIPVPVAVVRSTDPAHPDVQKLQGAWDMLGRPRLLTTATALPVLSTLADKVEDGPQEFLTIESLRKATPEGPRHQPDPDDRALILLTSGSTGMPKGVPLTHRNLLVMARGTAQQNEFEEHDVSLNWMPLEHVGAISFLQNMPTLLGCKQVHVPTDYILQDPLRWMELIDRHRGSITWGPNFAFNLVNEKATELNQRTWDLSCMRFLVSAGELVVGKTTERFVELLRAHGLPRTAIHPAFGMSETCSGISWSAGYDPDEERPSPFVDLGRPIPSAQLRIVDEKQRVLRESEIGRLQLRGPSVTQGYYENPDLNREVFVDDWFDTGDLGFLKDGRLTLTGRDKDEIIINGINYVGSEIESVAEGVDGVTVSFTAACAVRPAGSDTDQLALFFHPESLEDSFLTQLLPELQQRVAAETGIPPRFLIPLPAEEIPKTDIGKIQRKKLRQQFAEGHFAEVLQRTEILTHGPDTLPRWFHRRVWQRIRREAEFPKSGCLLLIEDARGLAEAIQPLLIEHGWQVIRVTPSTNDRTLSSNHFECDTSRRASLEALLGELAQDGRVLTHVLNLEGYATPSGTPDADSLFQAAKAWSGKCLAMLQALGSRSDERPLRLIWVASNSQAVRESDVPVLESGTLLGLLKTAPREWPTLRCRHLDLPVGDSSRDAATLVTELAIAVEEEEVAYREGARFVRKLAAVTLPLASPPPAPFSSKALYLVTGGLGGIGQELSRLLLLDHDARLLLIGRRPESDDTELGQERQQALRRLREVSPHVLYAAADVNQAESLETAVAAAEAHFGQGLQGVLHLAGEFHEAPLAEENLETLATSFEAKARGSLHLHQLLEARGGGVFLTFGSAGTYFGGSGTGAYSAANSLLNTFCDWQRQSSGVTAFCHDWTMWDEIGMRRGQGMNDALTARGYQLLPPAKAVHSLRAVLHAGLQDAVIGLDACNVHVRRRLIDPQPWLTVVVAHQPLKSPLPPNLADRFGNETSLVPWFRRDWPRDDSGATDSEALRQEWEQGGRSSPHEGPRNPLEERIAAVWKSVLGVGSLSIDDNFFALGGDSIQGAMVINKLQEECGEILHVVALFEAPTVAGFAEYLIEHHPSVARQLGGADAVLERQTLRGIVDERALAELQGRVTSPELIATGQRRRSRPVFVLAPPRSGTTLLRVILGGHPQLFAPPELYLLHFSSMEARRDTYQGQQAFWREGTTRALMELRQLDAPGAESLLEEFERPGVTIADFYSQLHEWLGSRTLVDKTPTYTLDPVALARMEEEFDQPRYIHLVRHPYGTMRSFEEASLDQLLYAFMPSLKQGDREFPRRDFAELTWWMCHRNIIDMLRKVPEDRQIRVHFEDVVGQPRKTVDSLCQFLGLDPHPDMLQPYQEKKQRMTDGVHEVGRMLGDFKFHQHQSIDSQVAETWRSYYEEDFLSDGAWQLAERLGYSRRALSSPTPAASQTSSDDAELDLDALSDGEVDELLDELLSDTEGGAG